MCKNLNLDKGDVYKSKYYSPHVGEVGNVLLHVLLVKVSLFWTLYLVN